MKVQIFSDLHLEFHKTYPQIKRYADTLILAGDIGCINKTCFKKFIHYVSNNWDKIYYVLGNHEYYHSEKTYHNLKTLYKHFFSEFKNITLLDKSYEIVGNTCFIGCTLWGYCNKETTNISCLKNIKIKTINSIGDARTTCISKEFFNSLYSDESQWLIETINNIKQYKDIDKIVVITHYPLTTSGTSHPKYDPKNPLSATDIDISSSNDTDITCISGHTHYSYNFMDISSNIYHVSNQLGYKEEYLTNETRFNDVGIFTI